MRKKENDVKRGGWSAHRLADESSYSIDTKLKLKQGDVDADDDAPTTPEAAPIAPPRARRTSHSKTKGQAR